MGLRADGVRTQRGPQSWAAPDSQPAASGGCRKHGRGACGPGVQGRGPPKCFQRAGPRRAKEALGTQNQLGQAEPGGTSRNPPWLPGCSAETFSSCALGTSSRALCPLLSFG